MTQQKVPQQKAQRTLLQQTVRSTVLRYLIPDLTQLVLKYCWPEKSDICELYYYGNYEKILTINNNWDDGLPCACFGGHMKIVLLLIEKGATNWNLGLRGACYRGNMKIAQLMIKKGATLCYCRKEDKCIYIGAVARKEK